MKWFLFKMLFRKTGFKRIMKRLAKEEIIEYRKRAVVEENYELAAYLDYYLKFKTNKNRDMAKMLK